MIRAEIRVRGRKDMAQARVAEVIRAAIHARNIQATVKDKGEVLRVDGKISEEELRVVLGHSLVQYDLKILSEEKKPEQEHIPRDYHAIQQLVNTQRARIRVQKGTISELENKADALKGNIEKIGIERKGDEVRYANEINRLNTTVRDYEVKCSQPTDVQDFLSETMSREAHFWDNFFKLYTETLQLGSEVHKIPITDLEKACLDYQALHKSPEFKRLDEQRKLAEEAIKKAKDNPFIKPDPSAEKVLEEYRQIMERDVKIKDTREELAKYTAGKRMRIALTRSNSEVLLTLPFRHQGNSVDEYRVIERDLLNCIHQALEGTEYAIENFNGLLRYKVPKMKTRTRNRLIKAISACEDVFTKLGGARDVIGIEVYKTDKTD